MSFNATTPRLNRRFALLGLLGLAGCGFAPVYGTGGQARALQGAMIVTAPDTIAGFRMRQYLVDQLGQPNAARYALTIGMSQTATPATITSDGDTTRFNLIGTSDWTLSDLNGQRIAGGDVETFTSYSSTGSTVATQAAADDARDRLARALGDLVLARIILLDLDAAQ